MDRRSKKACRHCGALGHFAFACFKNADYKIKDRKVEHQRKQFKQSMPMKKIGKVAKQWIVTRATWIRKNPPPIDGIYWECYLRISPQCPRLLDLNLLTLDHVVSRSRDPSRRFDLSNLEPSCWWCNTLKGSRSIDQFKPDALL